MCVESFLEGKYLKFSSNTGYVNPEYPAPVLAAFSHFTYHASNGKVLVTDLQGVCSSTGYTLTDPAIQSGDAKLNVYGPTDLGKYGIVKFFQTHRCNELCRGLKKPKITNLSPADKIIMDNILANMSSTQSSSTYTYQLNQSSGVLNSQVRHVQISLQLETVTE